MPQRSGTLQLFSVMFFTRDLTVSVLSRVVSQAVNISTNANNLYRIALLLVVRLDCWWRYKFVVICVVTITYAGINRSNVAVITATFNIQVWVV
jgi:hypothetical protein